LGELIKLPTFYHSPLLDSIRDYFLKSNLEKNTIFIFVPYIKTEILEKIIPEKRSKVVIMTTWDTNDLLSGSSELELYPYCKKNGFALYINNKIHLKVYSIGLKNMILGSGNVSRNGLLSNGNYECAALMKEISNEDRLFFEHIRAEARLVDDEMYESLLEWYQKQSKPTKNDNQFENIIDSTNKEKFLISALPMTKSVDLLIEYYLVTNKENILSNDDEITSCFYHDLANYGIELGLSKEEFLKKLKNHFFRHPFIQKIDEFINPEAYFGRIKEWIQNNCTDVPIPSRRELTGNVQVLYEWFEKLGDGKYIIDIPGEHSQRIRKIKS
jgi:hypothetical protein